MRIWVDLANAPHVSFFLPIIRRLGAAGHEVMITMRDFNHTVEIAEEHGIIGRVVGEHGGKSNLGKVLNLARRSVQLMRVALPWKPEVSVSHNSYTHAVAGRLIGSNVITIMDYEGQPANHIAFRFAHRVIVPDCFPAAALHRFGARASKILSYTGFKEQVYLSDYSPDVAFPDTLREACGLPDSWDISKTVLVTVRTPATMAAYHHFRNELFGKLLVLLNERTDLTVVVLPRNREQQESIQQDFPNFRIPDRPLIGADLVHHSDVLISAGGTMNREAAILGTAVYTIFAGELPAVDRRLVELGRLTELRTFDELSRIRFEKEIDKRILSNPDLCDEIVGQIIASGSREGARVSRMKGYGSPWGFVREMHLFKLYYYIKRLIPRRVQVDVRRLVARSRRSLHVFRWPVDESAGSKPRRFTGWPDGKRFALVLRHDVESRKGLDRVLNLARLEAGLGLRSAYYFVPRAYEVPHDMLDELRASGNEIGVHGWTHDGKLYLTRSIFEHRAIKINRILDEWQAVGFASPSTHHNFEWLHNLHILYDTSSFDTDPFQPQPDSIGSIFPQVVRSARGSYVELPYTLPQDFTLYVILREKDTEVWQDKLAWIADRGGMVLLDTHPDYMRFDGGTLDLEEYPVIRYTAFLKHLLSKYEGKYWHALPRDVAIFWRDTCDEAEEHSPRG